MSKKNLISCKIALMVSASLVLGGYSTSKTYGAVESSTEELPVEASTESVADENTIVYPDPSIKENLPDEKPSATEDFYLSVNYDFIKDAKVPDGYMAATSDSDQQENIQSEMEELLGSDKISDENQKKLSVLYKQFLDKDSRNAVGWESLKPYIAKIDQAETLDDFLAVLDSDVSSWRLYGLFDIDCTVDFEDATKYVICLSAPELHLDDDAEYKELTDAGKITKEADDTYFTSLLKKYGYSDDEIKTMVADQFSFEGKIAEVFTAEEEISNNDVSASYFSETEEELVKMTGDFPMQDLLNNLGISGQEKYVLDDEDYFKALGTLVTEENLSELKAYVIISVLEDSTQYTDEEAYGFYETFTVSKYGDPGTLSDEFQAYLYASNLLPELNGNVYAEYFYDDSYKEDVQQIVDNIKAAVRKRLENNTWLSEETRNNALDKFDAITVYIGTSDEDYYDYSKITVDPESDLFTNVIAVEDVCLTQDLQKAGTSVNKDTWGISCPEDTINGTYDPTTNSVHLTAAILQEPYYSKDYSVEQNYGGLGISLGHELTHAFDAVGSQFDKDGNLSNWWTDEDHEKFEELSSRVSERYSSYAVIDDQHVDGEKTIRETVADLGGAASAIDALKTLYADDPDQINYEDFFTQNAITWATAYDNKDFASFTLQIDSHAPASLRTNVNLTQFDEFYTTFNVKEGDKMYTAPEDRLSVW